MDNLPHRGLPTILSHLREGWQNRYPLWHTLNMAWRLRDCPICSIQPLTEEDIEIMDQLAKQYGLEPD